MSIKDRIEHSFAKVNHGNSLVAGLGGVLVVITADRLDLTFSESLILILAIGLIIGSLLRYLRKQPAN